MGLDKMLVTGDGKIVVTNDGASILDRIDIEHPAANLVVEVAEQQDTRAGDGTTSAVLLAGELLGEAGTLIEQGVHPTKVTQGYSLAASHASAHLDDIAISVDADDDERLRNIARTVVTGKWDDEATDFLADRAVETVRTIERDNRVGFERITRKTIPGGSFYDSEVIEGLVIDMEESSTDVVSPEEQSARRLHNATVALVDREMTVDKPEEAGTVTFDSRDGYEALREYEQDMYERYAERITDVGADVVFCQQSIDDPLRYMLADGGILAVERTRRDELRKLARSTGAHPVDTIEDLTMTTVGRADEVERRDLGSTAVTVVSGRESFGHVSLLARGGTEHVADETKRMLDDCFYALKLAIEDGRILPGGGAVETNLAAELRAFAAEHPGKEQLAIDAFADALETIPRTLAESAGLSPLDALVELRQAHASGRTTAGLDVQTGEVTDVTADGVLEPIRVKRRALTGAADAANMIVRIDDAVSASFGDEEHDHDDHQDEGPGDLVPSTEGYPWAVGHSMGHSHH
jgi:chaperonin GroEL (HSP60 family)